MNEPSGYRLIEPSDNPQRWDAYVDAHDKGTVFHTTKMHRVFEQTPKNSPWSRAVINDSGEIVAMVCAVRVETFARMAKRFASRSIWYCEPICDDSIAGANALRLLIQEHDQQMQSQTLFTEIRPHFRRGNENAVLTKLDYEYKDYLNYVVDLENDTETLEKNLSKSCRKQIRKCRQRGVSIQVLSTHDSIDKMHELVKYSYCRSGMPLVDRQIFHHALDVFGGSVVDVRLAWLSRRVVAAGICLRFKRVVYAWFGGSYRITGLTPFALLTWDEIESGHREGFERYDFGGAGWPGKKYGPRHFKASFGGELVHSGRYRKINSPLKLRAAKLAFASIRAVKTALQR